MKHDGPTITDDLNHVGIALAAPNRPPLSYRDLRVLITETGAALNRFGIGPHDPVAMALPNGPDAASCFLALAAHTIAAPLNPAYTETEFDFYLRDLGARAIIIPTGTGEAARMAAQKTNTTIIDLETDEAAPAGTFRLSVQGQTAPAQEQPRAWPEGTALILHTSGTTAKPKMVPLTRTGLLTSAANIARSLVLNPDDVCLTIMPLFHIHGLAAGVLAPLHAGGQVFCPPQFDAFQVFSWLKECGATWYSASPAMHRAILKRADRNAKTLEQIRLRFVRSSSAPLSERTMRDLEWTFGCPAIEAYGMTEASHQIASNPLPPGTRKPGSVGRATGPEIAIMGADGMLLPPGEKGEVVLRGDTILSAYAADEAVNAAAFRDGWFRTGDLGVLDTDGFLTLTGRMKEIINKGGEKISPYEVDAAFMDHPAVDLAVTFAVPHASLGEDLAAALVLKDGAQFKQSELKQFAGTRLAAFKVPRTVLIVKDIPKGPSGKVQRIGLARKLGLA